MKPRTRIGTLFLSEMRMVLRDRRSIVASIILPLLVMPLVLFGSHWSIKKREQKLEQTVYRYAVAGSQASFVRSLLTETRQRLAKEETAKKGSDFRFEEKPCQDTTTALAKGDIHFVLEGITASEARISADKSPKADGKNRNHESSFDKNKTKSGSEAPVVRIVFRADRDDSGAGMNRMRDALNRTRDALQLKLLDAHGFPLSPTDVAIVTEVNIASKGQVAGLALGRSITLLLLFFVLMGGMVVATDLLAGEKERGTLETLLTTSASRVEIVFAKHLVILAVALLTTLIQTANLLVYASFKLVALPENFAAALPPSTAVLLFFLFLPVAALIASILLLTSGYAKSYKEAQLYFFPVFLLALVPAFAPFLPGLSLHSAIVIVPVANIAIAAKEILIGSFDWPMIALSWLVTAAAAAGATRLSVSVLSAEKLITASEADSVEFEGGPTLFGRHVLRWFALLWGTLLMISNYTGTLDLRLQLTINLVGVFFGASLLMMRKYRLNPRIALALRPPKLVVWFAVLVAVPSGMLTGIGLFRLVNLFIPVSPKMLESFSEAHVAPGISTAELILFLAVMPALFEEIAFRGLLLYGLHRRLHPAMLALVVGVIFGLFHMTLFRLAPTAFLGVLLTTVTLLTGSIYPAMLWHALNNAIGLLTPQGQATLNELDPIFYVIGAAILACAFWIIWRNRTPYPGLRL